MITVGEPFQRAGKYYYNIGLGDGKQSESRGYSTHDAAAREAAKVRNALEARERAAATVGLDALGEPDGSLAWYARAVDILASRVVAGGGRDARDDLKALAFACNARKALQDDKELRAEVEELRKAVGDILAARKHGSRATGRGPGAEGGAGTGHSPR